MDSGPRITLTDVFEIHTLELQKIPHAGDGSRIWHWLKLLKTDSEEELDMLRQNHPELLEPIAILKELSADELLREEQRAYEKACWHEAAMKRVAEEKGRAEGEQSIVRIMLAKGLSLDTIAEYTGLSLEDIKQIAQAPLQ